MSDREPFALSVLRQDLPTLIDALCWRGGYDAATDGPNRLPFARGVLIDVLRRIVADYRASQAGEGIDIA